MTFTFCIFKNRTTVGENANELHLFLFTWFVDTLWVSGLLILQLY